MSAAKDFFRADYEVRRAFGAAMASAVLDDRFPASLNCWTVVYKGCERRPPYRVHTFAIRAFSGDGKVSDEMLISHIEKDS